MKIKIKKVASLTLSMRLPGEVGEITPQAPVGTPVLSPQCRPNVCCGRRLCPFRVLRNLLNNACPRGNIKIYKSRTLVTGVCGVSKQSIIPFSPIPTYCYYHTKFCLVRRWTDSHCQRCLGTFAISFFENLQTENICSMLFLSHLHST